MTFRGCSFYRAAARQFRATVPLLHSRRCLITDANPTPCHGLGSSLRYREQDAEQNPGRRGFTTDSVRQAVNDASTIDFAYMPHYTHERPPAPEVMRIPLLPDNYAPDRDSVPLQEAVEPVIRPQIETASADWDNKVSPMSEVTDNHAADIDPFNLTTEVGKAAKKVMNVGEKTVVKEAGMVQQVWRGFVEDFRGVKAGIRT